MSDTNKPIPLNLTITPEMVNAGILELRDRTFGESLDEIVTDIFRAMMQVAANNAYKKHHSDNIHLNEKSVESVGRTYTNDSVWKAIDTKRLSVAEAASKMGISWGNLTNILAGRYRPEETSEYLRELIARLD